MSAPEETSGPVRSSAGGLEPLLTLHRAGRIAQEYPDVPRLLRDLGPDDLARAGRLLARTSSQDVLAAHPRTPQVRIAVTGNAVLNGLAAALTAQTARHGLLAVVTETDFDGWVRDLGDPDGPYAAAQPDLALVVLDPAVVLDILPSPWRPQDAAAVLEETVDRLSGLARRFAETTRATVVLNTIPLPRLAAAQLVDHRSRARLGALWRAANQRLLALADHAGIVVLDLDTLLTEQVGLGDARLSVYARAHLSPGLLAAYAHEVGHLARHRTGRTRKVLALDLDGTVWGGVLGDDGLEGIEVADSYRGEAFRALQRTVRQLADQGVLIAAVSKNELEPVRQALSTHPRMTLTEDYFVRVIANWRPKHDNLAALAEDLNLGLDSIVFVDDSRYEQELVRRELPEVAVVAVDEEPAHHVTRLLADGWFDVVDLTSDDRARPERYREELVRKDFLDSFESLDDYLRELAVRVRVARADDWELPRIAQITLRTNQFNLTAQRLQPVDVLSLHGDPDGYVLAVHAADRFGDNGLVGAVLAHRDGTELRIDNFLLSCRVFARGVEQAALVTLLEHARRIGASGVVGHYRRTAKNGRVRDFYPRAGFTTVQDDGDTAVFRHDLTELPAPPQHVELTVELERTPA